MIVLSALIDDNFGHSLGTTETNARISGAVSVVAVGVMGRPRPLERFIGRNLAERMKRQMCGFLHRGAQRGP